MYNNKEQKRGQWSPCLNPLPDLISFVSLSVTRIDTEAGSSHAVKGTITMTSYQN